MVAAPPPARIVFASERTGVSQLYTIRTGGGGLAQLTFDHTTAACAVTPSPSGKLIAYAHSRGGCGSLNAELVVADADGTVRRSMGFVEGELPGAAWSPNEAYLAVGGFEGLAVRLARWGSTRWATGGFIDDPSWSPTGAELAFIRHAPGADQLVVRGTSWLPGETIALTGTDLHAPAWSTDGRRLAVATSTGVETFPWPVGTHRFFPATGVRSILWLGRLRVAFGGENGVAIASVRGDVRNVAETPVRALAYDGNLYAADRSRIVRIRPGGRVTTLYDGGLGDSIDSIGIVRPRRGARLRAPEPAVPFARAGADGMSTGPPIQHLAVDGPIAYVGICDTDRLSWRAGSSQIEPLELTHGCRTLGAGHTADLVASGGRIGTVWFSPGNNTYDWKLTVDGAAVAAGRVGCCAGDPSRAEFGDFLGADGDIVYSTWTRCAGCNSERPPEWGAGGDPATRIAAQTIYRVDGTVAVPISSGDGEHKPLALESGRIVVRTHLATIELTDLHGNVILAVDPEGVATGAALAGNDLVLLVPGHVKVYDATSGRERAAWPVPADARIVGLAGGRAAYVSGGGVYLLRIADGSGASLGAAADARLDSAGLFVEAASAGQWRGTVRFTPLGQLP